MLGIRPQRKKAEQCCSAFLKMTGRCERIRTFDPLHPMQVRYQAAPHTEQSNYIAVKAQRLKPV